jgi:hypothetical protein
MEEVATAQLHCSTDQMSREHGGKANTSKLFFFALSFGKNMSENTRAVGNVPTVLPYVMKALIPPRACLDTKFHPKFYYAKRRFPITSKYRYMHGVLNIDEIKN